MPRPRMHGRSDCAACVTALVSSGTYLQGTPGSGDG